MSFPPSPPGNRAFCFSPSSFILAREAIFLESIGLFLFIYNNSGLHSAQSRIIGSVVIEDDEGSIDFETEEYTITVSYTKEAQIPHGTVLTVSEITPDTDEYWNLWGQTLAKLNENATYGELVEDTRVGLTDAVFFDVSLEYNGEKIEPAVPLQVELLYKNGLFVPAGEEAKIVHFAETGIELIDEVETQDSGCAVPEGMPEGRFLNGFAYTQGSFSVFGAYSTGDYPDVKFVDTSYSPSAVLRAAGDTEIGAAKTLDDPDGDGVYDLSLSVTGKADQTETETVPKANVVLVIDVSGSMDYRSYSVYNYSSSTYDSNTAYYGIRNGSYVRVYRNPSDGRWYRNYSNYYGYYNEYNGTVYTYDGTRLEATKAAAKKLVDTLMEHNVADDPEKSDIMEITVVKFANHTENDYYDYNGTSTVISKSKDKQAVYDAIDGLWAGGGTNWDAALELARAEANSFKTAQKDEPVSVIFMTDGEPTIYGNNDQGNGDSFDANAWNAARDDARGIVTDGFSLYNIFAFGDGANYLRALTNYSQTGTGSYNNNATTYDGKFFFNASNAQALEDAFKTIADKINNNVGFAGVDVNDGVTLGVTNTSATVGQGSGTVNEESFRYLVSDARGNTVYTVVISGGKAVFTINGETHTDDSAETVTTKIGDKTITSTVYSVTVGEGDNAVTYKMSPASLDTNTGLVDWDLAGLGILEDGWTYTVTFSVWPNQWAYDLVADINNGKITKEQALASIEDETLREQIAQALVDNGDGTYSIRTNYKQTVDYYTADEKTDADGNVTTEYTAMPQKNLEQPNPVAISSPKLPMVKHWADDLQQKQLERLLYDRDGNPTEYKVTLDIFKAESLSALNAAVKAGTDPYKSYTLGWNGTEYQWNDEMSMAPGVMLTLSKAQDMGIDTSDTSKQISFNGTTYYVLEAGHYYQVTERNTDYHFDLVTDVYHPMKVDGTLCNVIFKEDGTSIEKIIPMTEVAATNTLRGGINLDKVVLDPDGNEYPTDDKFTFTITLTNENAGTFTGVNTPWYSVNGMYYHDEETGEYKESSSYPAEDYPDELFPDGNILSASADGKTASATLTITSVDALRIANVPINTTYTITETQLNGFTLDSSYIEIALTDADGNKKVEETTQVNALTVSGEIVPNRENNVTFKNKMAAYPSFYVYHSGDNTIEKIFADDDRVTRSTNEETGFTEMTFNIANETKYNFLYGGYYSDYAGKVLTKQQIVGGTYSLEDAATEYAYVTKKETTANWLKDTGATAYDGDNATWNSAEELKVSGLEMKPEKNGVYFLKEVPAARFLQPYTHFTFYRANNAIASLLSISDVDDLNYISTGFVIVDKNNTAKVCKTLTVKTAVGGNSMKLTPQLIFATKGATANDYLFWREVTGKVADGDKILNYWVTPDNLLVTGITERSLTNVTDRETITRADTPVKSTVGVYDPATAIPLS